MSKSNQKQNKFKIPESVLKLSKFTFKKFKKKEGDFYDSKKDLKKAYCAEIIDNLPEVIKFLVQYGHLSEVKEVKHSIYDLIVSRDTVKYMLKILKDDGLDSDYDLLPNVIYSIIAEVNQYVSELKEGEEQKEVDVDFSNVIQVSKLILKKKIKKLQKAGFSEELAFDVLSVIPTTEILKKSQYYHIHQLFNVLYEHAKTTENMNIEKLMKVLLKGEESYISSVILFALLERKDKVVHMTDSQKKLFNDITGFILTELESMDKKDIQEVIKKYISSRERDGERDSARRYYLSSLPEDTYPKIRKVVDREIAVNESVKKFF